VVSRTGAGVILFLLRVYQPKKPGGEDIAKFFQLGALPGGKGLVGQLPDFTADCDFSEAEMVKHTQPVLVVHGREETPQPLGVDEQRTTRKEGMLLAPRQAARVPDH
jgi:hypothetical protein